MDENWRLRNRTRDAIVSIFRAVRELQTSANLKSSEIVRLLLTVYRQTGDVRTAAYLSFLLERLEQDERFMPNYGMGWQDMQELEMSEPLSEIILPDALTVTKQLYKRSRRSPATLRDVEIILQIVRELVR